MSRHIFTARVARKDPGLPRFLVVPAEAAGGATSTFMTEIAVNGGAPFRRAVKPWGDGRRWFLELTEPQCRRLGIETGDRVEVVMTRAADYPDALVAAIHAAGVASAWAALTPAVRRALAEPVWDARQPATAERRIASVIARLGARSGG